MAIKLTLALAGAGEILGSDAIIGRGREVAVAEAAPTLLNRSTDGLSSHSSRHSSRVSKKLRTFRSVVRTRSHLPAVSL